MHSEFESVPSPTSPSHAFQPSLPLLAPKDISDPTHAFFLFVQGDFTPHSSHQKHLPLLGLQATVPSSKIISGSHIAQQLFMSSTWLSHVHSIFSTSAWNCPLTIEPPLFVEYIDYKVCGRI